MAYLPLDTVKLFVDLFDVIYLRDYKVKKINFNRNGMSKIYILNDELILLVSIQKDKRAMPLNAKELFKRTHGRGNRFIRVPQPKENYFVLDIEELTPNTIGFEFVYEEFIDRLQMLTGMYPLQFDVDYIRFNGWDRPCWDKSTELTVERINRLMPKLKLRERYDNWKGVKYSFAIIDLNTWGKKHTFAVAYFTATPEDYMKRLVERYIKCGDVSGEVRGCSEFNKALKTLLARLRKKRLARISYFVKSKHFRAKDDVWRYADKLLEQAKSGKLTSATKIQLESPKKDARKLMDGGEIVEILIDDSELYELDKKLGLSK
jgi:hypothetical protein